MSDALGFLQDQTFTRATGATAASFPPRQRLTGAQLAGYLDRRAFAVVATTRADGRPHAAMCSYIRRGAIFWLPTVTGAVRERNVIHQPWVSLVVSQGEHREHVIVIVEGSAAIVAPGDVPPDVRSRASSDWVGSWIRVRAERVMSYAADGALPREGYSEPQPARAEPERAGPQPERGQTREGEPR